VKLRELERSARLLKDQLETETARYQEALARERVKATPADARVIQRALAQQFPSFPKKLPIVVFATLATAILSLGAIVAGQLLGGGARVAAAPWTPAAQALPAAPLTEPAPIVAQIIESPPPVAAHEEAEAAREIARAPIERTISRRSDAVRRVKGRAKSEAVRRIDSARIVQSCVKVLVTPAEDEGRSGDTAIALGRDLSRRGRTLLVAADQGLFNALVESPDSPPKGMSDLMAGAADFAEAIHRDPGSRLHVMPGGGGDGGECRDLSLVVTALAHSYDFLVVAASPPQAVRLAHHVDLAFVIGGDAAAEALRLDLGDTGADAQLLEAAKLADLVAA
jgi:succinoglycan biosynthesis transport protein ExoP